MGAGKCEASPGALGYTVVVIYFLLTRVPGGGLYVAGVSPGTVSSSAHLASTFLRFSST